MKHIYHLLIFALGTALGVWIGINFPEQSKQQTARVQEAVSQAKISLLNHFMDSAKEDTKAEMQQMLKDEQQKLDSSKTAATN
jgi:hypothetical protein